MFSLAWPWLLTALPLPWLLRAGLPAAGRTGPVLLTPFYQRLQQQHHQLSARRSGRRSPLPAMLVWLLVVLAACRPEWTRLVAADSPPRAQIMLAVDISSSMNIQDDLEQPNRYQQVRLLLEELLAARPQDHFSLILFGSQAYLQSPATLDHRSLNYWLEHSEPGMAGPDTAIGDALGLGLRKLASQPGQRHDLLLITDGASNSGVMPPLAAARLAAERGVRIHSLGIGQPATGDSLQDLHALDEALLQELARLTGGRYIPAYRMASGPALQALLDSLPTRVPLSLQPQVTPLYPLPLLAAFLLALASTLAPLLRRRSTLEPAA